MSVYRPGSFRYAKYDEQGIGVDDPNGSGAAVPEDGKGRNYRPGYVQSPGVAPFDLPATTPPGVTGAAGSAALSSEQTWRGQQTWKITNTTTSGTINVSHAFAAPFAAPRVAPYFVVPVYVPDFRSVNDISIVLSVGDATFANTFTAAAFWGVGPTGHQEKQLNGWHYIAISPAQWAVGVGAPAWTSTINGIRIRFVKNGAGGNDGVVYVGQPLFHQQTVAQLLLYADDVHRSFYTNGLPIADALGLRFNLAAARGWINNPSYMNEAMYLDAQSRGHEICVHSMNQIGVNLLSFEAAIADIADNQAYVRDVLHAPFGWKHFVYPNGRYWNSGLDRSDVSVVAHMRDSLGFVLGRTTDDPARNTSKYAAGWIDEAPRLNQFLIPETFPNNVSSTESALRQAVDDLIERRGVGSFVMHHIGHSATHDFMLPGVHQRMLEYIAEKVAAGSLRCPTGEEFAAGLA
jgi:hypothetical protein